MYGRNNGADLGRKPALRWETDGGAYEKNTALEIIENVLYCREYVYRKRMTKSA